MKAKLNRRTTSKLKRSFASTLPKDLTHDFKHLAEHSWTEISAAALKDIDFIICADSPHQVGILALDGFNSNVLFHFKLTALIKEFVCQFAPNPDDNEIQYIRNLSNILASQAKAINHLLSQLNPSKQTPTSPPKPSTS